MRPKSLILIVIAMGCGLVASIGISQVMEGRSEPAPRAETEAIFVAKADVDLGEMITADLVRFEDWPKDKIPAGAIKTPEGWEGRRARTRLYAGEPLLAGKLIDELGGHAEKIPEGYRIHTVKVDERSGNAYLIKPGDRVDVLVYLRKSADVPQTITRTILRNVRVFAVNEQTERDTDRDGNAIKAKTVTLLVEPDQGEKLNLASRLGEISLSLRSPRESDEVQGAEGVTVNELLGQPSASATPMAFPGGTDGTHRPEGRSLLAMLGFSGQPATAPRTETAPAESVSEGEPPFTMDILEPTGVRRYEFRRPGVLPTEVGPIMASAAGPPTATAAHSPPAPGGTAPTAPAAAEEQQQHEGDDAPPGQPGVEDLLRD